MIDVAPLAEAHLGGLLALFGAAHSTCFCRFWHFAGTKNEWLDRCANRPEENARELEDAFRRGDASARGIVALDEGRVVGWTKLAPRASVPRLRQLPVYRALDLGPDEETLSVGCFLVDPASRRHGVARALLGGAVAHARVSGARVIEGYPRSSADPLHDEEAWQGPERLFVELGFAAVPEANRAYPVYRKVLVSPSASGAR